MGGELVWQWTVTQCAPRYRTAVALIFEELLSDWVPATYIPDNTMRKQSKTMCNSIPSRGGPHPKYFSAAGEMGARKSTGSPLPNSRELKYLCQDTRPCHGERCRGATYGATVRVQCPQTCWVPSKSWLRVCPRIPCVDNATATFALNGKTLTCPQMASYCHPGTSSRIAGDGGQSAAIRAQCPQTCWVCHPRVMGECRDNATYNATTATDLKVGRYSSGQSLVNG